MMKILYIATANPFVRSGGGIANLAYYKALNHLYPNSVDMVLPEEQVPTNNSIHRIFPAKRRSKLSKLMAFLAGSIHRYKECVSDILKKEKYDICFYKRRFVCRGYDEHIQRSKGENHSYAS